MLNSNILFYNWNNIIKRQYVNIKKDEEEEKYNGLYGITTTEENKRLTSHSLCADFTLWADIRAL